MSRKFKKKKNEKYFRFGGLESTRREENCEIVGIPRFKRLKRPNRKLENMNIAPNCMRIQNLKNRPYSAPRISHYCRWEIGKVYRILGYSVYTLKTTI